jgi:hypothetical protein
MNTDNQPKHLHNSPHSTTEPTITGSYCLLSPRLASPPPPARTAAQSYATCKPLVAILLRPACTFFVLALFSFPFALLFLSFLILPAASRAARDGSGPSNGSANGSHGTDGSHLRPMDAEQLRECGHRMVDFVADYYKSIEAFPVLSQVQASHRPLFSTSCSYFGKISLLQGISQYTFIVIGLVISSQPGYLKELLPDTAPNKPDSLEHLFHGNGLFHFALMQKRFFFPS